ncbi:uncharacterized protein LOC142320196 [Lycorma delicatula]|uniref:uncharacterized protein LOC142320196 n=1 Tax=Lycorma delicatula TaxID=130591 RepID=UPI003F5164FA
MSFGEAPIPQYGPPGFVSGGPGGNGRPSSSYGAPGGGNGFGGGNGGRPSGSYGAPGGGNGYGGQDEGKPEPFNFEYEVKDAQSGNDFGHRASSDGSRVTGQYHVLLPDGRNQIVDYTADNSGYNADVKYEGGANGAGGYPSGGGGGGNGGYPSGGSGGYPSGNGYQSSGGGNGYPSGGPPGSSYLPPGK